MASSQQLLLGQVAQGGYQISRSLRFNSADSAYLNRTPASAGNRKTWTWSVWVKVGKNTQGRLLSEVNNTAFIAFDSSTNVFTFRFLKSGANEYQLTTTQVFRDPSAWYHIVCAADSTQATNTNRMKMYVNGSQVTAFSTANYVPQNTDSSINDATSHQIGTLVNGSFPSGVDFYDGYLTEINFIDGQALTPSSFGETDTDTGVWQPIEYTGSYGTNGFYLNFSDNASTTTLGDDLSGNGNDWTTNNFSVTAGAGNDSLVDTPTPYGTDTGVGGEVRGNYATLNPLDKQTNASLQQGNLEVLSGSSDSQWKSVRSTIYANTGKFYFEGTLTTVGDATWAVGLANETFAVGTSNAYVGNSAQSYSIIGISTTIYKYNNATGVTLATGITQSANDVFMVAIDYNAGKIWLGRNGTWYGSGDPSAGTNEAYSITANTNLTPTVSVYKNTVSSVINCNFGQRPFAYTAPSGFKALCTQNLPEPTIVDGGEYFNTVLYTGNGSTQSITGVGFQPDWVWIKGRSGATDHGLYDSIRGVQKQIETGNSGAETTETTGLTAFGSDGFTVGSLAQLNTSSATYVAWNWKANGAGSSNTAGSISSTVSVNTTSGFSIVTYTGTGSAATIGHGLGVAPSMIIVKNRDQADAWQVYHAANTANPETDYLVLNTTAATADAADRWNDTLPTSTVFSIGNGVEVNTNTEKYVAYCFAPVAGYSAMSSFTGNGSADGPFIFTNHRPAFVLIKRTDTTSNWTILDFQREGYNVDNNPLYPNLSNAEATTDLADILSNGFKLRTTDASVNASGGTYIYMSLATNPFKFSLAR